MAENITESQSDLAQKSCRACEGETRAMTEEEIKDHLQKVENWQYEKGTISRQFNFKNYYETTAFVNAVAWIAHRENHHPDIEFGYKTCRVSYVTHSVNGISINDFICAAKVNFLI